jgi:hypothetical protein
MKQTPHFPGWRRAMIVSASLPLFIAFGNYDTSVTIL